MSERKKRMPHPVLIHGEPELEEVDVTCPQLTHACLLWAWCEEKHDHPEPLPAEGELFEVGGLLHAVIDSEVNRSVGQCFFTSGEADGELIDEALLLATGDEPDPRGEYLLNDWSFDDGSLTWLDLRRGAAGSEQPR